jgi:hypothetical protein
MPRWTFVFAFALVFYANGAAFIESFVNYPSWHLIGNDAFLSYHKFIGPRVITFLVVPALLGTVFTVVFRKYWIWEELTPSRDLRRTAA